jgi:hypothetical protein
LLKIKKNYTHALLSPCSNKTLSPVANPPGAVVRNSEHFLCFDDKDIYLIQKDVGTESRLVDHSKQVPDL